MHAIERQRTQGVDLTIELLVPRPLQWTRLNTCAEPRVGHVLALHGAVLTLFAVLTLTVAPGITMHPTQTVAPDAIDPVAHVWAIGSTIHAVTTWSHGLWSPFDANIFYPTPQAATYTDSLVGLLPILLPLHLAIANLVLLTNIVVGLSFVISAYGAFLLARRLTGSAPGGVVAGLAYGYCPLRFEQVGHLLLISTEWQIAAAYCGVRAWQSTRWGWWIAMGFLLGLTALSNLYYVAYLTLPLGLALLSARRAWSGALLRRVGVTLALAVVVTLPIIFAYLTRHATLDRLYGAAHPTDVLTIVQTIKGRVVDGALLRQIPIVPLQPTHGLFPGITIVFLALLAWRRRRARPWAIFAACSATIALGPALLINGHLLPFALPYAALSALVPCFNLFRDPIRAMMGFSLGLAVLTAWGTRDLLALAHHTPARRIMAGCLIGLVVLESWTTLPTVRLASFPRGEYWLAGQPQIRTILELPLAVDTTVDWQRQSEIMFDSTLHWKNLVNGAASIDPETLAQRRAILDTYPSPAATALLHRLRVDAVVLRLAWLPPARLHAAQAQCHVAFHGPREEICVVSNRAPLERRHPLG